MNLKRVSLLSFDRSVSVYHQQNLPLNPTLLAGLVRYGDSFAVRLSSRPRSDVFLSFVVENATNTSRLPLNRSDGSLDMTPSTLKITPDNWNRRFPVFVNATSISLENRVERIRVIADSEDGVYASLKYVHFNTYLTVGHMDFSVRTSNS